MKARRDLLAVVMFFFLLPFEDGWLVIGERASYILRQRPAPLLAPAATALMTDHTDRASWHRPGGKLRLLRHVLRGHLEERLVFKRSAASPLVTLSRGFSCDTDAVALLDPFGAQQRCLPLRSSVLLRRFSQLTLDGLDPLRYTQTTRDTKLQVLCAADQCRQVSFQLIDVATEIGASDCRLRVPWPPERWAGALAQLPLGPLLQLQRCDGLSPAQALILERSIAFRQRYL